MTSAPLSMSCRVRVNCSPKERPSKGTSTPPGKSCWARMPTSVPALKRAWRSGLGGSSKSGGFLVSHSAFWHCRPLRISDLLRPELPLRDAIVPPVHKDLIITQLVGSHNGTGAAVWPLIFRVAGPGRQPGYFLS